MHPASPFAAWDRTQPGSLKTRLDRGKTIHREDLALILESSPDCVTDPVLWECLLKLCRGELRGPSGRPPGSLSMPVCQVADAWIDLELEDVRAEIASGTLKRRRGDPEPRAIAADRVAPRFGNFTGQHLRNRISAMKIGRR